MNCILCQSCATIAHNELYFCAKCFSEQCDTLRNIEKSTVVEATVPIKVLDYLFIGDKESAIDRKCLDDLLIRKIIVCGKGLRNPDTMHHGISYLFLEIDDSLEQDLSTSITLANKFIGNASQNVLVHCYSGISRSASIVIAHLMSSLNVTYMQAFNMLKAKSDRIHPNSNFENQLISNHNKHMFNLSV